MSIDKIVGIEQEYAIALAGGVHYDPVELSFLLVNSYEKFTRTIWDYDQESPLLDARGFRRDGEEAVISNKANFRINNLLPNGARYYVDHAHPEFSTPECRTARDVVAVDRAGELILLKSVERAESTTAYRNILVLKNNSDQKGNSYGTHENYLVETPTYNKLFPKYPSPPIFNLTYLVPFLVTRQIICGAGKVGSENGTGKVDYQISQRADFFETVMGGQTTHTRPIVNTRDEPHADKARFSRLHVIIGDANMSETTAMLKVGTMQIVLRMIEDDYLNEDLTLEDPVQALLAISHDPTCKQTVKLKTGLSMTAVQIQKCFLERAGEYLEEHKINEDTGLQEVWSLWKDTLEKLEREPMALNKRVDWVIKKWLMERKMARIDASWRDARIRRMDILYHDIRRERGLFYVLEADNRVERIHDNDDRSKQFVDRSPEDTRAFFRSQCLKRYRDRITHANWDALTFEADNGAEKKIPLPDPRKGTINHVGEILKKSPDTETLLSHLGT
ncbi:proteasome accessory factor PafA2 family protein [Acidobacteriota bacterium]